MLAAVLFATGAGVAFWPARRTAQQPSVTPVQRPLAGAPAAASPAQRNGPADVAAVGASAAPVSAMPRAAVNKEFVEVCGIGLVRRSDLEQAEGREEPVWAQTLDQQSKQALAAIQARLEAGSPRQQVAAAVMRGDTEGAAQLAASSQDAVAYRLALRACRGDAFYRDRYRSHPAAPAASGFVMPQMAAPGPVPTACAALSLERLDALEPDDAWPWLARLNDSSARRDEAGVASALYQIAQRRRLSPSTRALTAIAAEVVGAEPTPSEAVALMTTTGTDMASGLDGSLLSVGRACRSEMLHDANRRQQCEQVARQMPGMVTEAVDAAVLYAMEQRLGLPRSPEALSREELSRALEAAGKESASWMEEPSCANISSMGRHLVALARGGELATIRARLKASSPASAPR